MPENQITADQLLSIIGKQTVTITMLETKINELLNQNKKLKNAGKEANETKK